MLLGLDSTAVQGKILKPLLDPIRIPHSITVAQVLTTSRDRSNHLNQGTKLVQGLCLFKNIRGYKPKSADLQP